MNRNNFGGVEGWGRTANWGDPRQGHPTPSEESRARADAFFGLENFVFQLLFKMSNKKACFDAEEDVPIWRKILML